MRMTSWFESVRERIARVMTGTQEPRNRSHRTRWKTAAFVESLEDRCLLAAGDLDPSIGVTFSVS